MTRSDTIHGGIRAVIRAGTRVREVNAGFIEALFEMRGVMESLAARRAAERLSEAHLGALSECGAEFEEQATRGQIVVTAKAALLRAMRDHTASLP